MHFKRTFIYPSYTYREDIRWKRREKGDILKKGIYIFDLYIRYITLYISNSYNIKFI